MATLGVEIWTPVCQLWSNLALNQFGRGIQETSITHRTICCITKSRIPCIISAGSCLVGIGLGGDRLKLEVRRLLAPFKWKRHSSPPDSKRSSKINRKTLAKFVPWWHWLESSRTAESPAITPYLKDNASRSYLMISDEVESSAFLKDCPWLARWRAARANMAFPRMGSSRAKGINFLSWLLLLS